MRSSIKYLVFTLCLFFCNVLQKDFALWAQPVITSQPSNQTTCTTLTSTMCVTTSTGGTTYQWYMSAAAAGAYVVVANGTPAGATYANGTTSCLSITNTAAGTYYYKCVLTSVGTSTTNATANVVVAFTANCGAGIRTYGRSSAAGNPDAGYALAQDPNGGIVVVGASYGYDAGHAGDGLIFNIDGTNNGAMSWGRHLGSNSNGNPDYFRGVIVNSVGNYVTTGRVESAGFTQWCMYLAEFTAVGGAPVWTQRLGFNGNNTDRWGNDVVQSTATDYVVVGAGNEQYDFSATPAWAEDNFIGRFANGTGLTTWAKKVYFGANANSAYEEANAVVENSDGTITFVGGVTVGVNDQIELIKVASTGASVTWSKQIGNATSETGTSIIIASNGDYIVTGYTTAGAGATDVWIARINSAGTIVWQHEVGTAGADEYGYSVIETSDGNYVVAGLTENTTTFADDALFFKIKSDGTAILWSRVVDSGADNFSWDIIQMSDLSLASIGQRKWDPDDDIEFISLTSAGAISAACTNSAPALTISNTALANNAVAATIANVTTSNGTEVTQNTTITSNLLSSPCGVVILPIELEEFSVTCVGNNKEVKWTTSTEQNNDWFTIEHSRNGLEWETLGKTKGAGNSMSPTKYKQSFKEKRGYKYYRLKQTDYNGNETHSPLITTTCISGSDAQISVYPNPATSDMHIEITSDDKANYQLQLLDITGRVVINEMYSNNEGATEIKISLSDISNGIYYLKITSDQDGYNYTTKLIKN